MNKLVRYTSLLSCALIISACAATTNPTLDQARSGYETTKKDPSAARVAPVALRNAKKNIDRAQSELNEGDEAATTHYAGLAQRHVEIAQTQAEQSRLQRQVEKASERRRELRLRAQQEQTISAQRQAASAQQQAATAEQQAAAARARAEKLENELRDLQAQRTERGIVLTLGDVLFDYNKANLRPGAFSTIEKLGEFMREYPERRVRIEGHTDNIGSDSYNQQLSERRALSVNSAIIAEGIDPSRMTAVGLGEAYPKASNSTEAGRQQNRRVEIIISDEQGQIRSR